MNSTATAFSATVLLLLVVVVSVSADGSYETALTTKPEIPYKIKDKEVPKSIAVQGLIYCKSGSKVIPLKGATAKITCLARNHNGIELAPFSVSSCPADDKGYFLAKLSPTSSTYLKNAEWELKECKAYLEKSPLKECNVPLDVNGGIKGAHIVSSSSYRLLKNAYLYSIAIYFRAVFLLKIMKTKRKLVPKDVVMGSIGEPGTVGTRGSSLHYVGEGGQPLFVGDSRMNCPSGQQAINMGHAHLSSAGNAVDNVNHVLHIHGFSQVDDTEALGTLLNQTRKQSHDSGQVVTLVMEVVLLRQKGDIHLLINGTEVLGMLLFVMFFGQRESVLPSDVLLSNVGSSSDVHVSCETNLAAELVASSSRNQKRSRDMMSRTTVPNVEVNSSEVHVSCETNVTPELVACSSRSRKCTRDVMSRTTVLNVGGNSSGVHVPCETNLAPELVASSSRTQKHTRDVMSRTTVPNIDGSSVSRRRHVSSGHRSLNTTFLNNDYVFSMGSSDVHINGSGVCDNLTGPPLEYKHTGKCEYSYEHCGARFYGNLRRDIVEDLIELLDNHNALVQLFRTAYEKLLDSKVPPFKVRLFSVVGARKYELPIGDMLGAIIYEPGPDTDMDFNIVIEQHGYSKDMKMVSVPGAPSDEDRRLTMKAYYSYMLHDRNDIRNDYLSGIYDTIRRGDSDGSDCSGRLILPQSFTRGPHYMYVHYLDALAMCRVHRNPSYFITFTCNVKWPKIVKYMVDFPGVTTADRADIVDSVFEMKIHEFVKYLRDVKPFGRIIAIAENILCAINVEHCGWTTLIKYLFKYISKGTDKIAACVVRSDTHGDMNTPSTSRQSQIIIDEIKNYLDSRYISPHEACWRLFEFEIHYREPAVQVLAVHGKNMQRIVFRERDQLQSVANNPHKKTTLSEWLDYSKFHTDGRHLTYLDFPFEYVWSKNHRYWQRRRQVNRYSIIRMSYVHPATCDLFYQRILLSHQKGCKNFRDIRTVHYTVHLTCRAACEAMGLPGEDKEWEATLTGASTTATPRITNLHIDPSELENYTKYKLEACLNHCSRSLTDFGISLPPEDLMSVLQNRLLMKENSYDRAVLAIEKDKLLRKLNNCQHNIFNLIIHVVTSKTRELIFVYGHGRTGKTFLWKTIIYALRAQGKIVLAVASSGIASLLLPSGQTAHSQFKLPLDLSDTSMCSVTKNTQLATLLKETDLIIWDELLMNDRRCFETLDRNLKDILDTPNRLFGGKPVMLGGDFRQTLLVKKRVSRTEIIGSSIVESYLWRSFKLFVLIENMRLTQGTLSDADKMEVSTFAN
nr:uncharacterized protein [Tanacetum cinerariifolium]